MKIQVNAGGYIVEMKPRETLRGSQLGEFLMLLASLSSALLEKQIELINAASGGLHALSELSKMGGGNA